MSLFRRIPTKLWAALALSAALLGPIHESRADIQPVKPSTITSGTTAPNPNSNIGQNTDLFDTRFCDTLPAGEQVECINCFEQGWGGDFSPLNIGGKIYFPDVCYRPGVGCLIPCYLSPGGGF